MPDVLWYYARDDEQLGPISTADLRQLAAAGKLAPEDFVWKEGMEQWAPASELQGLFPEVKPPSESVGTSGVVLTPQPQVPSVARASVRPSVRRRPHARVAALVIMQGLLWGMCILTVLIGAVLFSRAWMRAAGPQEELAAGALYSTFFIGAYVTARCGEKLSNLVLGWIMSRRDNNGPS